MPLRPSLEVVQRTTLPRDIVRFDPVRVAELGIFYAWTAANPLANGLTLAPGPTAFGAPAIHSEGIEGLSLTNPGSSHDQLDLGSVLSLLSGITTELTIAIYRRCTDTAFRNSSPFGCYYGNGRVLAHAPWSNGVVYWYGGGTGLGYDVSANYGAKDLNPETMVFTCGTQVGREIWRRGILLGSAPGQINPLSLPPDHAARFSLGAGFATGSTGVGGDAQEIYLFVMASRPWTRREIEEFEVNPAGLFEPTVRQKWEWVPDKTRRRVAPLLTSIARM